MSSLLKFALERVKMSSPLHEASTKDDKDLVPEDADPKKKKKKKDDDSDEEDDKKKKDDGSSEDDNKDDDPETDDNKKKDDKSDDDGEFKIEDSDSGVAPDDPNNLDAPPSDDDKSGKDDSGSDDEFNLEDADTDVAPDSNDEMDDNPAETDDQDPDSTDPSEQMTTGDDGTTDDSSTGKPNVEILTSLNPINKVQLKLSLYGNFEELRNIISSSTIRIDKFIFENGDLKQTFLSRINQLDFSVREYMVNHFISKNYEENLKAYSLFAKNHTEIMSIVNELVQHNIKNDDKS